MPAPDDILEFAQAFDDPTCTAMPPGSVPCETFAALTLAERLAVGYGDDDPFVKSWRAELFL